MRLLTTENCISNIQNKQAFRWKAPCLYKLNLNCGFMAFNDLRKKICYQKIIFEKIVPKREIIPINDGGNSYD